MMHDTYSSEQVTDLVSSIVRSFRAGGSREDGCYTLEQVAERTGFALSSLKKDCRAGRIEHTQYGDARGMTPSQLAKFLERLRVGGDLHQAVPAADDMAEARRATRRSSASRAGRSAAA